MSESNPFSVLTELAERARTTAVDLPPVQDTQTHATGLGYNLLGQRFVSSMDDVGELMRVPQTTRIPGVKNFVLGVGNVRGRLMTVLDLALFFGQSSKTPRAQRRVLAVDDDENLIGFVIDDSFGMQHFPADAYSEKATDIPEMFTTFIRGAYEVAGVQWPVLNLNLLAEDPRLESLAGTG
ncbi:MAG: purine-binding chemotaxis protein CheW [Gammaproteobacteria bacterium]|jgi:twitching motility protein PilI|nr:purine-binding chemotaxis protein CheW [Gammaproteobacteria bacterium]MBT4493898.1 purine-binding chemotaxis protein CheW [Gammaproteobacteria bacterium]MBT7372121.1 purine-binding chemotaxis protein CheW [Gammaproteobacteria bacterium]